MTPFITLLREFAEGKITKSIFIGTGKEIRLHHLGGNYLVRVFNAGMGCINFAQMENGVLLINELQCSKGELGEIERDLKIPYELVKLGYPDYYSHGLSSIKVKYANDKKRTELREQFYKNEINHDEFWEQSRALI